MFGFIVIDDECMVQIFGARHRDGRPIIIRLDGEGKPGTSKKRIPRRTPPRSAKSTA